jgi:hydroxyacylglutathione hydrolase
VAELSVELIPLLRDNYAYLIRDPDSDAAGVVDPSVADGVLQYLAKRNVKLTHIFNTHHHWDHTGGNGEIKAATGAIVVGPHADEDRIPDIDVALREGETYQFGSKTAEVYDIPGHTRGHIAFFFRADKALFCGDTLFALGCGRMFEGTPQQMWGSLAKLRELPDDTRIFCGHEYTQANCAFALTVEPENSDLQQRWQEIDKLRAAGQPTIPSTMGLERRTNPFLRADQPTVAANVGLAGKDPVRVFAEVRRRKDAF